jgi:lipopolysaccharide export system protein LptA
MTSRILVTMLVFGLLLPIGRAQDGPEHTIQDFEWPRYEDGRVVSKVRGERAVVVEKELFTITRPQIIIFHEIPEDRRKPDGNELQCVYFTAESGQYNRRTEMAVLTGNVFVQVIGEDKLELLQTGREVEGIGWELKAQSLNCDFRGRRIFTDEKVRFFHEAVSLIGTGVVGRDDLQELTILSDVTAEGDFSRLAEELGRGRDGESTAPSRTEVKCAGPVNLGQTRAAGLFPLDEQRFEFFRGVELTRTEDIAEDGVVHHVQTEIRGDYVEMRIRKDEAGEPVESMLVVGAPTASVQRGRESMTAHRIRILDNWNRMECDGTVDAILPPEEGQGEPWRIRSESLVLQLANNSLERVTADHAVTLTFEQIQEDGSAVRREARGASFRFDPEKQEGRLSGYPASVDEDGFELRAEQFLLYPEQNRTTMIGRKEIFVAGKNGNPDTTATASGPISIDGQSGRIDLSDRAAITTGTRTVEAETLVIYVNEEAGEPDRMIGLNGVKITDSERNEVITGSRCVWSVGQGILSVEGAPTAELRRESNIVRAAVLEINTETGRIDGINPVGKSQRMRFKESK